MQKRLRAVMRSNATRWVLILACQAGAVLFSAVTAFWLRFDFGIPHHSASDLIYALSIWICVKSLIFQIANLNRRGWRYVSTSDVYRLFGANLAGSIFSCPLIVGLVSAGFPRSIFLTDFVICLLATCGVRVLVRMIIEAVHSSTPEIPEKNAFIYGAGDAGVALLKEIRNNPRLAYHVCGFLDDDPARKGECIAGVPVLGPGAELGALTSRFDIELVLIAIPSATGSEMTRMLSFCHEAGVECKTVPGLGDLIGNSGLAGQIRDVAVEDLLGRTPVHLQETEIRTNLEGRMVLVTGAAGSIGSELCRQIARFHPKGIVGFEIAESPLFEIDREMRRKHSEFPFYPEIGSIQDVARIDEVLEKYRPSVLYHAAAYKHVPLMETHVFEAVENNVFGTYNLAVSAAAYHVDSFVMISTDKAVRPTSMMGASKRVAELILQTLQNGGTQYVMVRFGNVLGSSGSVVPIFKQQIACGGPVTVTHPEMRRFFMTIPEACQLVLQASVTGKGGQICILDMGQPTKIIDLAKNLILLSGLQPNKDIRIEFTGSRPGEKLCEELSSYLENTVPTTHEKIRIFMGDGLPYEDMKGWLEQLRRICDTRDLGGLLVAIKEAVLDYSPGTELLKRAIVPSGRPPALVSDLV